MKIKDIKFLNRKRNFKMAINSALECKFGPSLLRSLIFLVGILKIPPHSVSNFILSDLHRAALNLPPPLPPRHKGHYRSLLIPTFDLFAVRCTPDIKHYPLRHRPELETPRQRVCCKKAYFPCFLQETKKGNFPDKHFKKFSQPPTHIFPLGT